MDEIKYKELETRINQLELKILRLEKDYIPNQDLKGVVDALVSRVTNGDYFVEFYLDSGYTCLTYLKIFEMYRLIADKGNFYILLTGSSCDADVGSMYDYESKRSSFEILMDFNIKRVYDNRVPANEAYLIALENLEQVDILDENIIKFIRR